MLVKKNDLAGFFQWLGNGWARPKNKKRKPLQIKSLRFKSADNRTRTYTPCGTRS